MTRKKKLFLFAMTAIGIAVLGGLVHPFGNLKRHAEGADLSALHADPATLRIIERSCQNCHSEQTEWPWYSRIAPVSWLVERDVARARSRFNLSRWGEYGSEQRASILSAIGAVVRTGEMPPARYTLLHPEAKLNAEERLQIYQWSRTERRILQRPSTQPPSGSGLTSKRIVLAAK
jgi:hypothetical protein